MVSSPVAGGSCEANPLARTNQAGRGRSLAIIRPIGPSQYRGNSEPVSIFRWDCLELTVLAKVEAAFQGAAGVWLVLPMEDED